MADFPTLTQGSSVLDFEQETAVDPTMRSQFENGYQLTRNRFTVVPKKWKLVFEYLTEIDKSTLETFEKDTAGFGGTSFNWENTDDGTTYDVRFAEPVKWTFNPLDVRVPLKRWKAEIILVEANPTS